MAAETTLEQHMRLRGAKRNEALAVLAAHEFDGTTPFVGSPADLACTCLHRAHSLALVVSVAIGDDNGSSARNIHLSAAVDAIGMLVSLAHFATSGVE